MTLSCSKCGEQKPLTDFYRTKKSSRPDNRSYHCRECSNKNSRAWAKANPQTARKQTKKALRNAEQIVREYIAQHKARKCTDCRIQFPACAMDFDHVRGKKIAAVSSLYKRGLITVKKEIAKCELVCSNCHRVRTYERRYKRKALIKKLRENGALD